MIFTMFALVPAAGKCSQQAELSGENINITYKPDGTHIAVGNRVLAIAALILANMLHVFRIWFPMLTSISLASWLTG